MAAFRADSADDRPVHRSGDYSLAQENGPWLIVAASFSAATAPRSRPSDLARELRERFRLKAYLHEMSFKFGDEVAWARLG